eukprot:3794870-Pleurochrysis_carterae.AAC.1
MRTPMRVACALVCWFEASQIRSWCAFGSAVVIYAHILHGCNHSFVRSFSELLTHCRATDAASPRADATNH